MGCRRKDHNQRMALRIYANQTTRPCLPACLPGLMPVQHSVLNVKALVGIDN